MTIEVVDKFVDRPLPKYDGRGLRSAPVRILVVRINRPESSIAIN